MGTWTHPFKCRPDKDEAQALAPIPYSGDGWQDESLPQEDFPEVHRDEQAALQAPTQPPTSCGYIPLPHRQVVACQ